MKKLRKELKRGIKPMQIRLTKEERISNFKKEIGFGCIFEKRGFLCKGKTSCNQEDDVSQEPPKLANGPITRNMAKKFQARLNSWAQREVSRRIQDQTSMLMEDELKESTKFINILEVIMEDGVGKAKFEIQPRLA